MLLAIFHDRAVVDEIIAERKVLYKEASAKADPKDLEVKFKGRFDSRRDAAIDSALLDYSVSKTNPKYYE